MTQHFEVAIVGGGVAGLAAALALGRESIPVALIELNALGTEVSRSGEAAQDFDSRVSALTPRSIAFLKQLDAWDGIENRRHCLYSHMTVWDGEGTGGIEFDAREVSANHLGTIVENRVITAALFDAVRACSFIRVLDQTSLCSLDQIDSGYSLALTARVSQDDSREENLTCSVLLAADGARSPTRSLLGMATREWSYQHTALVCTAQFEQPHRFTAWQRFLQTGPLALLPVQTACSRLCSIVWSCTESLAQELNRLPEDQFRHRLAQASEQVLGEVTECSPRRSFPLRQCHAIDYVLPSAAVLGDAAHSIHPLAGQGVNLGLADVEVLAGELLRARRLDLDLGDLAVLKRYQRQRKGENLLMMGAMDGFKQLFEQETPSIRWLRNAGMRSLASLPMIKRRIIQHALGVAV
ncbi:MAG: FAD-dependent monooxygenase [Pseudomonadota bacterium]